MGDNENLITMVIGLLNVFVTFIGSLVLGYCISLSWGMIFVDLFGFYPIHWVVCVALSLFSSFFKLGLVRNEGEGDRDSTRAAHSLGLSVAKYFIAPPLICLLIFAVLTLLPNGWVYGG